MRFITQTYQWWHVTRKKLPVTLRRNSKGEEEKVSSLCKIWNVSRVQPYRWAADPDTNDDVCSNPFDLLINTFSELKKLGEDHHIENGLRLLAEPFDFVVSKHNAKSDRDSSTMELMDIQEALGNFCGHHRDAISDGYYSDEEQSQDLHLLDEISRQVRECRDTIMNRKIR